MKHERQPTLKQKRLIESKGVNADNWRVIKDCSEVVDGEKLNVLHIIHIHSIHPRKLYYSNKQ